MKRFSIFAHEGIRWIFAFVLLSVVVLAWKGVLAAILPFLILLALMLFYYDPVRELPSHPLGVMSPLDGKVMLVDLFYDPFLKRTAKRIRIQSGFFRAYHDRSPTEGKLMQYWPVVDMASQGYDKVHTRAAWWIHTDEKDDVTLVVRGEPFWGIPRCYAQVGERVGQARRCGRFPLFCEVDILIGEHSIVSVNEGVFVRAGIDTLASFNHDVNH